MIGEYLKSHERWQQYVQGELLLQNSEASAPLGGQKPNTGDSVQSSSGEEDGPGMANNELVNVFTQYLVKQGFTSDFPKNFLADDDEYDDQLIQEQEDDEFDYVRNISFFFLSCFLFFVFAFLLTFFSLPGKGKRRRRV